MERMGRMMAALRADPPRQLGDEAVEQVTDYRTGVDGLPASDVLAFRTVHGKVIVRPSGTEPKLKLYSSARGETRTAAGELCRQLESHMAELIAQVE